MQVELLRLLRGVATPVVAVVMSGGVVAWDAADLEGVDGLIQAQSRGRVVGGT